MLFAKFAWGLLALLVTLPPARGADQWGPVPGPMPDWVQSSLQMDFTTTAEGTRASYRVSLPNPCYRMVLGTPIPSATSIAVVTHLELLAGVMCPQVVVDQTGTLDLGVLAGGHHELTVRSDGVSYATFGFDVPSASGGDGSRPVITGVQIEPREIVVRVAVPAGVKKVTLESRTRLGHGAWVPRAVQRLAGDGATLTFRVANSEAAELLRVRGDATEALPQRFYQGQSDFNGQTTQGTAENPPSNAWRSLDAGGPPEAGDAAGGGARDVVESDIWAIRGDWLYFFNQYRGLQVVDIKNADLPVVTGTLPIPAAGEQMYALGDQYVILLARAGCSWGADQGSQALIVQVGGGTPTVVKSLAVPGYIQESRLVGTALYVASQTYRVVTVPPKVPGDAPSEQWEYGTVVSSFDLSDPAAPQAKDTLWYPGYGNVVAATDRFLFIVLQDVNDWWTSQVYLIDITAPDGVMKPATSIRPAGRVADKFKLNLNGDVFTVISQVWRWENRNEAVSVLETFSLAEPTAPRRLGEIRVGKGESLFATRFDGDRAYIVTFERIDPLWIVDLRDPAHPQLHGELEVPGWSTYIQPLGDRLVTVGIATGTNWQVAVSLFDVKDPSKPALLSKVPLGENSSWSEANYDEKAFTVLPGAGLILVPYQGWAANGYASRVQLIDLGAESLTARGFIEHAMQPRRATVHGERILSLSGRELLTVNATDRDHPQVTHDTALAWPVDQVIAVNGYLLEIERGNAWWGGTTPTIRAATEAMPDQPLSRLTLARPDPIAGATQIGDFLYLLQADTTTGWGVPVKEDSPPAPQPPNLFLTVVDLSVLPELKVVGATETRVDSPGWIYQLEAFSPRPGVLVFSGGNSGWWWGPWALDVAPGGRWMPWWGGFGSGQFFAFDVNNPLVPRFASFTQLASEGEFWGFSETFLANGLFYLSHQKSEFIPDPGGGGKSPPDPTPGRWITRYFLSVVDFADPFSPTVRKPVNIPGQLSAVTHGGEVLYTTGYHWDAQGQSDWTQFLDVLAYDGVEAALVASQKLGDSWTAQMVTVGDHLILARYDSTKQTTRLETWRLTEQGTFVQVGLTERPGYPSQLTQFGNLILFSTGPSIAVWDATNPAVLRLAGESAAEGCLYPSLGSGVARSGGTLWLPLGDFGLMTMNLTP